MNITWFKKSKDASRSSADVSITISKKQKYGASIILRNGYREEIAPQSDYLVIGVPADDSNKLVFMASDKSSGWKINKRKNTDTYFVQVMEESTRDLCARFAGNYSMELYEETGTTLYCINRRNVL